MGRYSSLRSVGFKYEELVFSIFCVGIAVTLVFWPIANSILCLLFSAYWLLFSSKAFLPGATRKYWILLFCSLYLVVIIGSFHSTDTREAIFKLQQKSAYILFPIILGTSTILNQVVCRRTFSAFVLSTLAACIFCIVIGVHRYVENGDQQYLYGYGLVEPLKSMTPYIMSIFCLLSLLIVCNKLYHLKSPKDIFPGKFLKVFLPEIMSVIFLFSFLLILGNRNTLIAACLLLIFYCLKFLKRLVSRILAIACLFGFLVIAININPFLNKQWNELSDFSVNNSIQLDKDLSLGRSWGGWQLRVAIWKCSLDVLKNNLFFGVGTGDVKDALQASYENRKFYFASRYNQYNTHNQYLQESVANGILGLIVFLSCLVVPWFSSMHPDEKGFYRLFLFCFAIVCVTDTPLELNKGILLYTFFNALIFFKSYNFKNKIVNGKTATHF